MLISDKIVFVELQKTGSTHIKRLLKEIVGGKNDGKHNVPTPELLDSGKTFIGSVRDPWGWYLSLWSYGCQQQGELFQRLTNEKKWAKTLERMKSRADHDDDDEAGDDAEDADKSEKGDKAGKAAGKAKGKKQGLPEDMGPERAKSFWYADPENAEAFREWLRVVCSPKLRRVVESGFAQSPIGKLVGLMTFRYFHLFVKEADKVPETVRTLDGLKAFETKNLILQHIIRQDRLAEDFAKALQDSGVVLTEEHRKLIYDAKPTNKSSRPRSFDHYYNPASVDLVARRERFIIERFGYTRPRA